MNYSQAKAYKHELETLCNEASNKLQLFERNEMGLVLDHIRDTEEYKDAKDKYYTVFTALQDFNKWYVKEFKKEIRQDRKNRYVTK